MAPPGSQKNNTNELWPRYGFSKNLRLRRADQNLAGTRPLRLMFWMGAMRSIQHTLREKESELKNLQREIEILRAAATIVAGNHRQATNGRRGGLLSQPQMIRVVMLDSGRPLHVDEIAEAVAKRFNVNLQRTDITPTIYRAIRNKRLFRKVGTNTFGLLESATPWPERQAK